MADEHRSARLRRAAPALAMTALVLAGCIGDPTPSPAASPSPTPAATPLASPTPTTPLATTTPAPTPTPAPELALALPEERDERAVEFTVNVEVPPGESGRIEVTITSLTDTRIDEIAVRWPTELGERLFLVPYAGEIRIPLLVPWTRWVEGPGERGEPAGTTTLGWGPLDAGATLTITMTAERRGAEHEPLAFDLHVLAGEALLSAPDGEPARARVEVP